jgi:mRNA interferase HigB
MAMTVLRTAALDRFCRKHRDATQPLENWLQIAMAASWHSIIDVRMTYPSADGVAIKKSGGIVIVATVFNIRGNEYRLITVIDYGRAVIRIVDVLRHDEYDKDKWKERL